MKYAPRQVGFTDLFGDGYKLGGQLSADSSDSGPDEYVIEMKHIQKKKKKKKKEKKKKRNRQDTILRTHVMSPTNSDEFDIYSEPKTRLVTLACRMLNHEHLKTRSFIKRILDLCVLWITTSNVKGDCTHTEMILEDNYSYSIEHGTTVHKRKKRYISDHEFFSIPVTARQYRSIKRRCDRMYEREIGFNARGQWFNFIPCCCTFNEHGTQLFCSEMVARVLIKAHVWSAHKYPPPYLMSPDDIYKICIDQKYSKVFLIDTSYIDTYCEITDNLERGMPLHGDATLRK